MFKRQKTPKHILFLGEKSDTRDYIIEFIKQSKIDPEEKIPEYTFSTRDLDFSEELDEGLLKKTDGLIFIVNAAKAKELSLAKEYFWEYFVWNEESEKIPVVISCYQAEKALALTKSEIIEAFSLIRLTDRFWDVLEIHENKDEHILACLQWLDEYIEILGIKPKVLRTKRRLKT
jgi:hypothetical protein